MRALVLAVAATLVLAGCGQKGPLYLPDQKPAAVTPPVQPAATPATPAPPSKKKTDEENPAAPDGA
jgi:predicted small lipoprotein YifL